MAEEDEAYYLQFPIHDTEVLPHDHAMDDLDDLFPIARVPAEINDSEEFDCWKLAKPDSDVFVKHQREELRRAQNRRRR